MYSKKYGEAKAMSLSDNCYELERKLELSLERKLQLSLEQKLELSLEQKLELSLELKKWAIAIGTNNLQFN